MGPIFAGIIWKMQMYGNVGWISLTTVHCLGWFHYPWPARGRFFLIPPDELRSGCAGDHATCTCAEGCGKAGAGALFWCSFLGSSDWCWVLTSQTLWLLLSFQNRWLRLHNDLFISIGIFVKYNSFAAVALNMNVHRKRHPLDMYPIHSVGMHLLCNSTWMMLLRSFCYMDPLLNMWDWNPADVCGWKSAMGFSTQIPGIPESFVPLQVHIPQVQYVDEFVDVPVARHRLHVFFFGLEWISKSPIDTPGLVSVLSFWWTTEPLLLWVSVDRDVFSATLWSPRSPLFVGEKSSDQACGHASTRAGTKGILQL